MMGSVYDRAFKAKAALVPVKRDKMFLGCATQTQFDAHPNRITQWKALLQ